MRPAAELLMVESVALRPVLDALQPSDFDRSTVCTGWSVRDVLAHCGAALTQVAADTVHSFSPEDNQRDVDERRSWPLAEVLAELYRGYATAAPKIDAACGRLDGVGLGEWMHGGDVRDAVGAADPYASEGIDVALDLLIERSVSLQRPAIDVIIGDEVRRFGSGDVVGHLKTDRETFVRLCGGRRPDPARFELTGIEPLGLGLFS